MATTHTHPHTHTHRLSGPPLGTSSACRWPAPRGSIIIRRCIKHNSRHTHPYLRTLHIVILLRPHSPGRPYCNFRILLSLYSRQLDGSILFFEKSTLGPVLPRAQAFFLHLFFCKHHHRLRPTSDPASPDVSLLQYWAADSNQLSSIKHSSHSGILGKGGTARFPLVGSIFGSGRLAALYHR